MHITAVLRIRIRTRIQIPRIHVFLGLLDPDPDLDPLVRGMDPDPDLDYGTHSQQATTLATIDLFDIFNIWHRDGRRVPFGALILPYWNAGGLTRMTFKLRDMQSNEDFFTAS
jgi:hypothetical protein